MISLTAVAAVAVASALAGFGFGLWTHRAERDRLLAEQRKHLAAIEGLEGLLAEAHRGAGESRRLSE